MGGGGRASVGYRFDISNDIFSARLLNSVVATVFSSVYVYEYESVVHMYVRVYGTRICAGFI